MRTIINLVLLVGGFLGGIYFGRQHPQEAAQIDQMRSNEQAKIQPQIEAAVAKAKIELINKLQGLNTGGGSSTPGSGFASSGFAAGGAPSPAAQQQLLKDELAKETSNLQDAQSKIGK
jgi:hypothetical protein